MVVTIYVLFDNHADSWSGHRTFLGVFGSYQDALNHVRSRHPVWERNRNMPLEPYFSAVPHTVDGVEESIEVESS